MDAEQDPTESLVEDRLGRTVHLSGGVRGECRNAPRDEYRPSVPAILGQE